MPSTDALTEGDLPILEALFEEPSLSQRKLAERAGMSLTKTHFALKRLVERGIVRVRNASKSTHKMGYLYLLTPRGIEAKAKLTYAFMSRTATQFQELAALVEGAVARGQVGAKSSEPVRVYVVGTDVLTSAVSDIVHLHPRWERSLDPDTADFALVVGPPGVALPTPANLLRIELDPSHRDAPLAARDKQEQVEVPTGERQV